MKLNHIPIIRRARIRRLMAIVFAIIIMSSNWAHGAQLEHFSPNSAYRNNDIFVEAEIDNSEDKPFSATLYYRKGSIGAFVPVEMEIDIWDISASIPAEDVVPPSVEYYFEIEFGGGRKEVFPTGAPNAAMLYSVNVISLNRNRDDFGSVLEIISPDPGKRYMEGDGVLVAFSLNRHVREIDPENIRVEIDGIDMTRRAYVSDEIVSLTVRDLNGGAHQVVVYEMTEAGKIRLSNWGFSITPDMVQGTGTELPFDGSLVARTSHEDISSNTRDIYSLDGTVRGGSGKFKWAGKVFVTSLEDTELQPQNRFLGMVKYSKVSLKVGDTSPRFSQFSIYGNRTRGVEFNFDSRMFSLDVAVGDLLKSIEGDNSAGVIIPGTYRRTLMAIKPGFYLSDRSKLSFNVMKAKDDINSIDNGVNPEDNLVVGGELYWNSRNRRVSFNTETAISLYNSNISEGAMSQAEALEDIIVVNQYFDPLPTDEGILDDNVSQSQLATKVLGELVKSSLAHETSIGLRYFGNDLKVAFKSVGRSFKSLGSQGVSTDTRGFSVSDRLRLFSNRVYLNVSFDSYQDNLNDRKPEDETLKRQSISGGITYYTPDNLPNISVSSRQYARENSDDFEYIQLPDGSQDSTGNPVADYTTSYGVSLDHSIRFGETTHNAVLSYNSSLSEDDYNPNATSDISSVSIRLGSKLNRRLDTNVSFSSIGQSSMNNANVVDYNKLSLGGKYMLLPRKLWVNGTINVNFASGGNDLLNPMPTDPGVNPDDVLHSSHIEYNRMQLAIGSEYRLGSRHKFGLGAYRVFHEDKSYSTYWSGREMQNSDSPNFVEQDDLVTRFQYTFTF